MKHSSIHFLRLLSVSLMLALPLYLEARNNKGDNDRKPDNREGSCTCTRNSEGDGNGEGKPCPGNDNRCVDISIPVKIVSEKGAQGSGMSDMGINAIRIVQGTPSPDVFTPMGASIRWTGSSFINGVITENLPSGISHRIGIIQQDGKNVFYEVLTGSSEGRPVAPFTRFTNRIELTDNTGAPVTSNPSFILLKFGNGQVVKFPAQDGATPVSSRDINGRVVDFSGLEDIIIREDGALRQILAVGVFLDFVIINHFSYAIRFYTLDNMGTKNAAGFYEPVGTPYKTVLIENPSGNASNYDRVRVTTTHGSDVDVADWRYIPAAEDWELTTGNGLRKSQLIVTKDENTGDDLITEELRDENGVIISTHFQRIGKFPWNRGVTKSTKDPGGLALTTTYDYYHNPHEPGFGNLRLEVKPSGFWKLNGYDAEGRIVSERTPYLDSPVESPASQSKVRLYSYTPVDSRDVITDFDDRPREITEETLGIKTYHEYWAYFNETNGEFVKIREIATVQSSSYGAASNLRTVWTYYPSTDPSIRAGRLKSVEHPNKTLESYSYSTDGNGNFVETIDQLALVSGVGQPIALKSTRMVKVFDERDNLIKEETHVYDGSAWQLVTVMEHEYSQELVGSSFPLLKTTKNGNEILLEQTFDGPFVVSRKDASGIETQFTYDALDRLDTQTKIGAGGRPDIVTNFDRTLGALDCGCDGQATVTRSAGGLTLTSSRTTNAVGDVASIQDENGYTTSFSYDYSGRITTQMNPDTSTQIRASYLDGREKSVTGTALVNSSTVYGVNSDGTTFKEVRFGTVRFRRSIFDLAGHLIREETPAFGGGTNVGTFTYNAEGLLIQQSAPELADTLFEYDQLGNLIRSGLDVDSNGSLDLASSDRITDTDTVFSLEGGAWFMVRTTHVYPNSNDGAAVLASMTHERLSGFSTGSNGLLVSEIKVTDVHGNETVSQRFIDLGTKTVIDIVDVPDSNQNAVSTIANGLLISRTSTTVAAAATFNYDALERQTSTKDPRHTNASTVSYQAGSNLVSSQTDAAGHTSSFIYYANGEVGAPQLKQRTNALGLDTYFEYNARGQQTRTWGDSDYPVELAYDNFGKLTTLTTYRDTAGNFDFTTSAWPSPAGGDVTTFVYDAATGLQTRKQYSDGKGTDFTYTAAGRLANRTWERGITTTYGYDNNTGELLSVDYSDSTTDLVFTYDRLGRQATVADAVGTRTFAYNGSLQLESESISGIYSKLITRNYQGAGSGELPGRTSGLEIGTSADPDTDYAVDYGYDSLGRFNQVIDSNDTYNYTYLTNSNLIASISNSVSSTTHTYEANRNLRTVVNNQISGLSISKYTYRYDAIGRRTDRVQEGSAFSQSTFDAFGYNNRSEVIASDRFQGTDPTDQTNPVAGFGFDSTYDQIGNRITSTENGSQSNYTTNGLNQYTTVNSDTLTYDADGNLTSDGNRTLTWNGENRLTKIEPTIPQEGDKKLEFAYDYRGRRVQKTAFEYQSGAYVQTSQERFVYDDWNLTLVLDAMNSNAVDKTYTSGIDLSGSLQGAGGVGGLLSADFNPEAIGFHYYHYDVNGNVTQLVDEAGNVSAIYEYSPFGKSISVAGSISQENVFRFSTKYQDVEADLLYYGFRYFSAALGKWLNRDPVSERGGLNLNGVPFNNLINRIDLLGLVVCECPCEDLRLKALAAEGALDDLDREIKEIRQGLVGLVRAIDRLQRRNGRIDSTVIGGAIRSEVSGSLLNTLFGVASRPSLSGVGIGIATGYLGSDSPYDADTYIDEKLKNLKTIDDINGIIDNLVSKHFKAVKERVDLIKEVADKRIEFLKCWVDQSEEQIKECPNLKIFTKQTD